MFCCSSTLSTSASTTVPEAQKQVVNLAKERRDAIIGVIALSMIALFFFSGAAVLYGMGTLPPTTLMGLGMLPYLGGTFLNFLSLGIFTCSLFLGVIAAVKTCKQDKWQAAIKTNPESASLEKN